MRHTRGWSTPDLLRLRAGDASDAPDAVVLPGPHDEVVGVLAACTAHRVAVVPYAGGTSVVGGLVAARDGFAGVITVDLARLDGLTDARRGVADGHARRGPARHGSRGVARRGRLHPWALSAVLRGRQHRGYAATRSAGQSSAGYGRFDEMVVA